MTSDGGVMLLAAVENELADRLASLITDPRNPLLERMQTTEILPALIYRPMTNRL